jgi:cardiolipin synthase
MRRLLLIAATAALTLSCSIGRSMRSVPVGETPDLGAPVFDSIDINWRPLARTLALQGKMLPVSGNSIEIFTDGRTKFAAFNEDLRNAEHFIDMEYYRFAADTIAGVVKDILLDKAEEGVPVRMILESRSNAPKVSFYRQLRKAEGVFTVDVQRPGDILGGIWNIDFRDHRKIAVIDGKYCYTGGMNIADVYHTQWRDTHVKLEGPIVEDFERMFDDFWIYFGGDPFAVRPLSERVKDGGAIMQVAQGGPYTMDRPIKEGVEQALVAAKDYFYIQTPYLCPPVSTIKAMKEAVDRGVDVRLMVPKSQDVPIMLWVNHYFYKKFLKAGVKIYERNDPFMHSKSYVTDDYVSCYGSANLDNRSMFLNYENNLYIYDRGVAEQSKEIFFEDLTHSEEVTLKDTRWSLLERIIQNFLILVGYSQW